MTANSRHGNALDDIYNSYNDTADQKWDFGSSSFNVMPLEPLSPSRPSTRDNSTDQRWPVGEAPKPTDEDFRFRTMAMYLANRTIQSNWMPQSAMTQPSQGLGVLLKQSRGQYSCCPDNIYMPLLQAVQRLNVGVAITIRPEMLGGVIAGLEHGQEELKFKDGSQLQILNSYNSITSTNVKKFQYGCLLRKEEVLLIWQDDVQNILAHAQKMEDKILSYVWGASVPGVGMTFQLPTPVHSPAPSLSEFSMFGGGPEKPGAYSSFDDASDGELALGGSPDRLESLARPVKFYSAIWTGLGLALAIVLALGSSLGTLLIEVLLDGSYIRLALLATSPLLTVAGLFFFQIIFSNIWQLCGPISGYHTNSRFYSCHKPNLAQAYRQGFSPPHITIQMPVYKEGLEGVIVPTIKSLQAAISFYESRGGSASVFVNDDGLRLIPEDEAQARKDFYHDNGIGWVARPKHNSNGFIRKGKFKKASNMNFALNISQKVEAYMQDEVSNRTDGRWDNKRQSGVGAGMLDEFELEEIYEQSLERVLRENPLAMAAGNIRMGEIILIIDSDTRVPVDCLLYGAAEMFLSPEVAIVQHSTGVMQVSYDYFENGITYFTNLVYTSIRFCVGAGEVAPFVGHNAFLRWAAIQDVGVVEDNGYVAYWSESHVSEDFDVALRVQIAGSIVRCASYHNDGFQEGVSLTIYDEIARWQKYAYGCSEMVFHPLYQWPLKGPFTPLFRTFVGSNMILSSKIGITAYIFSYFAIGLGVVMTLLNYIIVGWWVADLDHFYLPSFEILVSLIFVFNIMGGVSLAVLRYRVGEKGLVPALLEIMKWTPMMAIFFSGLSFHVSGALLAHLLHIDMQWGATSKEKEDSHFFKEIPKIFFTFKILYVYCVIISAAMIYLALFAPIGWRIDDYTAIVPLSIFVGAHAVVPLALNPSLMVFNY